ncbi:Putative carbonic anhydrase-like protein 2 [Eufriesea mexicana]|nr:Putative carbonic anhydrase-like protein 2 [Eufriesea mexicana]
MDGGVYRLIRGAVFELAGYGQGEERAQGVTGRRQDDDSWPPGIATAAVFRPCELRRTSNGENWKPPEKIVSSMPVALAKRIPGIVPTSSGPSFWGLINPQWSLCSKGRRQSPINIEPDKLLFDRHLRPVSVDKHKTGIAERCIQLSVSSLAATIPRAVAD